MYKAIPIEGYWLIISDENASPTYEYKVYLLDESNVIAQSKKPELNYKLIIAQSKPVHEGIPLFDAPWEVDVEKLADNIVDKNCWLSEEVELGYKKGFTAGYLKRSETHKWTDEEVEGLILEAEKRVVKCIKDDIEFDYTFGMILGKMQTGCYIGNSIQTLKKPKVYEVELEMESESGEIIPESGCAGIQFSGKLRPKITNNKINILSWKEM